MDKESKENTGQISDSEQSRSRVRAIKILGNRQMSSNEMERRLVRKGESVDTAKDTVQWLEEVGALGDAEYASAITRHYSAKGYGIARIKDELFKRGVPRDLWDEALMALEESDMDEAAGRFLEKKLRGSSDKNDLRKALDALCRRGFSYEDARAAIARYLESIGNAGENEMVEQ
jgi:regulatory protein